MEDEGVNENSWSRITGQFHKGIVLEHTQTASHHKIIFSIFAAQTAVYCSPAMRLKAGKEEREVKKKRIK